MPVEEYIQYEAKAERRHEYINGQLFEMPGEKEPPIALQVTFTCFCATNLGERVRGFQPRHEDC